MESKVTERVQRMLPPVYNDGKHTGWCAVFLFFSFCGCMVLLKSSYLDPFLSKIVVDPRLGACYLARLGAALVIAGHAPTVFCHGGA